MRIVKCKMLRFGWVALLAMLIAVHPLESYAQSKSKDSEFREKIVGSWEEGGEGISAISIFYSEGRYDGRMTNTISNEVLIESVDGTWWIEDGKLYNQIKSVTPSTFPLEKSLCIDIIVSITDDTMTLIDEKGVQYTKTKVK